MRFCFVVFLLLVYSPIPQDKKCGKLLGEIMWIVGSIALNRKLHFWTYFLFLFRIKLWLIVSTVFLLSSMWHCLKSFFLVIKSKCAIHSLHAFNFIYDTYFFRISTFDGWLKLLVIRSDSSYFKFVFTYISSELTKTVQNWHSILNWVYFWPASLMIGT